MRPGGGRFDPEEGTMRCAAAMLVAIQALWMLSAQGADRNGEDYQREKQKQQAIYQARGEQRDAGYVVDRGLDFYAATLGEDFGRSLPRLGPGEGWLDIGAGRAQAIRDYFTPNYRSANLKGELPGRRARAVAISIEDRRDPDWARMAKSLEPGQVDYFFDKPLRDYSVEQLGRFSIITDMFGGFSYSDQLSMFMEKVLDLLQVNGSFYSVLQDVSTERGGNQPYYAGSPFLTRLTQADGSELKVCTWLKRISCVEVSCQARLDWKPPVEVYQVRKTCGDVRVPPLERSHYQAGTPPERRFVLRD